MKQTRITHYMRRVAFLTSLCFLTGSAYAEVVWDFDVADTQKFAKFFKQSSAVEGKTNAEVIGIDIHRAGFSWDDMNTWRNSEGILWKNGATASYACTVWGVNFNKGAAWQGRFSQICWTKSDANTPKPEDKWNTSPAGIENLSGTLELTSLAATLHVSDTKIDTIRVNGQNSGDAYFHFRRNSELKHLDLSGCVEKVREVYAMDGHINSVNFQDANSKAFGWGLDLSNNYLTFSTLPQSPRIPSIYEPQAPVEVGTKKGDHYEVVYDAQIDLSKEALINEVATVFVWKDVTNDEVIQPATELQGKFTFGTKYIGRSVYCEMTNSVFPKLVLKTVPLLITDKFVWNFDLTETAEFAAFFKQPSSIEGKTNAEVLEIDINRPGFSWEDMNTWRNKNGELWQSGGSASFAKTLWGVNFNMGAAWKGKSSGITWTSRGAGTENPENKWDVSPAGYAFLSGTLAITSYAGVLHISDTKIDTLKVKGLYSAGDAYFHFRRNSELKQLDLSGCGEKVRQVHAMDGQIESVILENVHEKAFGWALELENNHLKFSTLPTLPKKPTKYTPQATLVIGTLRDGKYVVETDEIVDLSSEFKINNVETEFIWMDENNSAVTPSSSTDGKFTFSKELVGKTLKCSLTNKEFPLLTLTTVPVVLVNTTDLGGILETGKVCLYPNPVKDLLQVRGEAEQIKIFDAAGSCVFSTNKVSSYIDLSHLPAGIYYVQIISGKENQNEKIVKY